LLKGKEKVLVKSAKKFNRMYSLMEYYIADKDDNAIIIGFFCCIYCDFKILIYIDMNLYYSANGLKDIETLNLITY
jgi:hypothetical protein